MNTRLKPFIDPLGQCSHDLHAMNSILWQSQQLVLSLPPPRTHSQRHLIDLYLYMIAIMVVLPWSWLTSIASCQASSLLVSRVRTRSSPLWETRLPSLRASMRMPSLAVAVAKRLCPSGMHQWFHRNLVSPCTGLYKPVQANKATSRKVKQAMSDFSHFFFFHKLVALVCLSAWC